ncbi:hypothetical protein IW140_006017 [Coemansia sp. RSA 1813]|nr:hypothetical protein IW140_006017 [Coemansia sp. RSA 1813]
MLPDNVDDDYGRSIALADAMDVKVVGSPFRDAARVKALFPVLIEGRESALVVMASGSVGDNVSIDTVSVYTHLESGQIVETKVDVSSDSDKAPNRAERKPKRN